jgi:hypothetical protein
MIADESQQIAQSDLKIATIRDLEGLEKIRPVWERMQQSEPFPVPNTDINRYIATVKELDGAAQPYIVLLSKDGRPAAMAVGRIENRRLRLRLGYKTLCSPTLKCLSVVYGGIIGQPTSELCRVLVFELIDAMRHREADVVFFNHLRIGSQIHKLCKAMPSFWRRSHFITPTPHWQTHLPNSVEELYSRVPKSRRRKWRRDLRRMEKANCGNTEIVCYSSREDLDCFMDVACRVERATYKSTLAGQPLNCQLNRSVLEQSARDGWLRAYVLYIGDSPSAFQTDVQYANTHFSEQASFDPKWHRCSPGIVLLLKVLEELCQDGKIRTVDYGFGDALYKRQFGTDCWLEECVYIYAPRLYQISINMLQSSLACLSLALRYVADKYTLTSWVKRRWRSTLQKNNTN